MSLEQKIGTLVHEDKVRQSSDLGGISYLIALSRENSFKLFLAVILLMSSVGCLMFSVRVLGWLFEELSMGGTDVWPYAMAFLAFEIGAVVLRYYGSIFTAYITNAIILEVRKKLFTKLTLLPVSYFDRQPLGRTVSRITSDVEGVENFFSQILASSLCSFIELGFILLAMLITDPKFGLIIVFTSLPAFVFTAVFRAPIKFWFRIHKKLNALILSRFAEFINGFEILKGFHLEQWSYRKFKEINLLNYDVHLAILHWNSFIRPMIVFLCSIPVFFVLLIGAPMVIEQTLSIAIFVSFVRFTERFLSPVRTLSHDIQIIQDALTSAERVRQMFDEIEELHHPEVTSKDVLGDVTFNNVRMDYLRDKDVLKGISFHAAKGMKTGLVGETGAGKTTTINLIPALYNFTGGDITIDNISIRDWSKPCLRRHIGYINQDVVIFQGTLRENIVCARTQVGDDEIHNLAQRLGFSDRMRDFPAGLDTHILEHGQNLSAGERQIVAFMRMMIKDPRILILDEATANVDHDYEKLLHNTLFDLMADKTCFIIAHRLTTVKKCDLILVFKDGQIVERGTHEILNSKEDSYYRSMQSALMM